MVPKLTVQDGTVLVRDYFTRINQDKLNADYLDLGSSGPILINDPMGKRPHLLVVAGKGQGNYVLNRDDMGKYQPDNNSQIVQSFHGVSDCFGAPAYWNRHVYYVCEGDFFKDFKLESGLLSSEPVARSNVKFSGAGATPSVSANGQKDGIVWVVATPSFYAKDGPAVLHALDASDISHELYNSKQNSAP